MREIEFRGKDFQTGKWRYGSLINSNTPCIVEKVENGYQWHYVDRETVGQYTGLKDTNSVEIFEGDIVKTVYDDEFIRGEMQFSIVDGAWVVWNDKIYIEETFDMESSENSIVIGNIHDNSELLDEEEDNSDEADEDYLEDCECRACERCGQATGIRSGALCPDCENAVEQIAAQEAE